MLTYNHLKVTNLSSSGLRKAWAIVVHNQLPNVTSFTVQCNIQCKHPCRSGSMHHGHHTGIWVRPACTWLNSAKEWESEFVREITQFYCRITWAPTTGGIVRLMSNWARSITWMAELSQRMGMWVCERNHPFILQNNLQRRSLYLCDPQFTLNMQLANGEVDQSLGLAWNVPFTFGDLTLYLQVHIIWLPAYNILLGRPFHVLTSSVVHNFVNEDQTLTLTDPNTGDAVMVPTISRDKRPTVKTKPYQWKAMAKGKEEDFA